MSGGNSYPISREYQKLLGENLDFFQEVLDLYSQTGLGFMATDADSKLQTEVQEDGNLSLKLSIALDNNYDKTDGRIYLEDQFIFDGKTKAFQRYQRNFSLAGTLAEDHPFREFQKTLGEIPKPDDKKYQAFAQALFRARPQALNDKWFQIKKDRDRDYAGITEGLEDLEAPFHLSSHAAQNSYALFPQGKNTVLLVHWATQDPAEENAGPVMLQEKFIFDSNLGLIQEYTRSWQINPDFASREEAQSWADRLNQELKVSPQDPQELFYAIAGKLYPRSGFTSLNDESVKVLSKHWDDFILPLATEVQGVDSEWTIRTKDPESGIQVRQWENGKELVLSLVIENALDTGKARLKVVEHFFQDAQGNWTSQHRAYQAAPNFFENIDLLKKINLLNRKIANPLEMNAALADDLLVHAPELKALTPPRTKGVPDAQEALWQVQGPDVTQAITDKAKQQDFITQDTASDHKTMMAVGFIGALALEQIAKKQDHSKAWLASDAGVDFGAQEAEVRSLFEAASEMALSHPDLEPLAILRSAGSQTGNLALVDRLSRNVWAQKINDVAQETDPDYRAEAWLEIATKDLWDAELVGTAQVMVAQIKGHEKVSESAGEFLALIEGGGTWGTKGEFISPKVLSDLGDPWMVGGMMAAPLIGAATEASMFARFGKSKKYWALAGGIGMEAGTFTAISDLGMSFEGDPAKVWSQFNSQTLATALMFSFLRVGHKVTGRARAAMTEGSWGPRWGGKLEAPAQVAWPRTASGSVITAANPQLTQLTPAGNILSGAMNHGAGISAMWLSQSLASTWMPHLPQQDWRGGLFDAMLGYGHAMMGFRMADGLSLGGLHRSLAQIRMGMQDYDTQFAHSQKIETDTLNDHLEGVVTHKAKDALRGSQNSDSESISVSLPLRDLLLSMPHSASRIDFEMQYNEGSKRYGPSESSLKWIEAQEAETSDPNILAILKQVKNLSLPRPEGQDEVSDDSSGSKEGSLNRAEEILKQIAEAYDQGEPDKEYITGLFQQVSAILEIGARRSSESDSVAPQTLKVVEAFMALAKAKEIEISPPKDVTDRVLDWIHNISAKGKGDNGEKIETLADPNPEDSGEYAGVLAFSGGDPIDIRLGQEEQPLYNAAGRQVARAWAGVHQNEQVFIVVEALDGEQIFIDGEPYGESWIYPQQHPIFTVGGREYRLFQPAAKATEHNITGMEATTLAPSESMVAGIEAKMVTAADPQGYDSWLQLERASAGLEVAKEIPPQLVADKQAWIYLHVHRGKSQSNHGVANLLRYPRVLVGSRPSQKFGTPGTETFQVIGSDHNLAEEQALIFLDIQGNLNLVRLLTPHESQTVFVNGQEIRPETPVKVFKDSVIELQGLDGERFQLDLVPHDIFAEQFGSAKRLDTQGRIENSLTHPDTTSITSANARIAAQKAEFDRELAAKGNDTHDEDSSKPNLIESHLREDTFLGALAEPEEGTMVVTKPVAPEVPTLEPFTGELPETVELDFTELSKREALPKPSDTPPTSEATAAKPHGNSVTQNEESGSFHIDVDEGSAPKEPFESLAADASGRFDLPDDGPHEDSMAGFDASFAFDGEASPAETVGVESGPPVSAEAGKTTNGPSFGEALENIRARYSVRFGEDPLAGVEPIFEKDGGPIQKVMVDGAVKSVSDLVAELEVKLATPKKSTPPPIPAQKEQPKSIGEIFGVEAGVLQRAYQSEFQKDPFGGAKPVYGKDGITVKRVDVDGRVIDLDAFLERLAISIRRQVAARRLEAAKSTGSQLAQLAQVWERTFDSTLLGSHQKVLFDEGQPAAIKDQENGAIVSVEDFIAQKTELLERGFNRAEQATQMEALDPSDSSPRVQWVDHDAPLSEHIRYIEEEMGIQVSEARMVELQPEEASDAAAIPDPIEELNTGEFHLVDTVPPPPPMAEANVARPEVLLSPVDLAAAQSDFEHSQSGQVLPVVPQPSLELPHPDITALISPRDTTFAKALKKVQADTNMIPNRVIQPGESEIQGRVNDSLGFLDQLRQFTKAKDPQESRLASLVVLDHLEEALSELYRGSQDYALRSNGSTLTLSTFLTEGTRSVQGDMGKPSGQIIIPFHADQSKAMMMRTVFGMLRMTQIPIEVSMPLNYKAEGLQAVLVKYSDPYVAEVFSQVNEMMAQNPRLFADYPVFMGHQIDSPGEPLSQASHYRLSSETGESPLELLKRMLITARNEVAEIEGPAKISTFKLKIYQGLQELGLIP